MTGKNADAHKYKAGTGAHPYPATESERSNRGCISRLQADQVATNQTGLQPSLSGPMRRPILKGKIARHRDDPLSLGGEWG